MVLEFCMDRILIILKMFSLLNSLKISKKLLPQKKWLRNSFTKNKNAGNKIKNIGAKILKKTIKELDSFINNEFKKT